LYTPVPAGRYIFEAAREKIHVVLTKTDEQHTSAVHDEINGHDQFRNSQAFGLAYGHIHS
jgi:hypothetical protein